MSEEQVPAPEQQQSQATGAQTSEPGVFSKVAEAMMAASQALGGSGSDAAGGEHESLVAGRGMVSKSVYATSYCLAYGVVFPTLLVARLFPKNNSVYYGLVDGSHAARDTIEKMQAARTEKATSPQPAPAESDGASVAPAPA